MEWKGKICQSTENKVGLADPWYVLIQNMVKSVGIDFKKEGINILEVGCGLGGFSLWVSRECRNMTGLDIGKARLIQGNALRKKMRRETMFIMGDAQSLPFRDEAYDIVVCSETLEHIPDYEKAFNEIVRVTRNSGYIITTFPNYINSTLLYGPVPFLLSPTSKRWNPQPVDLHLFNTFSIDRIFDRKDLEVLLKRGVSLVYLPSSNSRIKKLNSRLNKVSDRLKSLCINIGVIAQKIA